MEGDEENKIVESQLKARDFEVKVDIRGILLGRLNDVDDTESLLLSICWAPLYWLLSIGPSKAFSSTSQNGQELTGSLKKRKKDFTFSVEGEG